MTFAHAWLVLLARAPLVWAAWEWRGSARRVGYADGFVNYGQGAAVRTLQSRHHLKENGS
jgi:hypothetical protein